MTNVEIGKKLGLSHSAVSRLRRGQRLPSIDVMLAIDSVFGWDLTDQVKTRSLEGPLAYSEKFERHVQEYLTRSQSI